MRKNSLVQLVNRLIDDEFKEEKITTLSTSIKKKKMDWEKYQLK